MPLRFAMFFIEKRRGKYDPLSKNVHAFPFGLLKYTLRKEGECFSMVFDGAVVLLSLLFFSLPSLKTLRIEWECFLIVFDSAVVQFPPFVFL